MNILFNISNHSSDKWSVAQKQNWDRVIDIPFPNIDPNWDTAEVIENAVSPIAGKLGELVTQEFGQTPAELNIMLQGEFSFCHLFKEVMDKNLNGDKVVWWIPTTERKTVEKVKEDGTTEKISIFEFCRWRKF